MRMWPRIENFLLLYSGAHDGFTTDVRGFRRAPTGQTRTTKIPTDKWIVSLPDVLKNVLFDSLLQPVEA